MDQLQSTSLQRQQQIFDDDAWQLLESLADVSWPAQPLVSSTSAEQDKHPGLNVPQCDTTPTSDRRPQTLVSEAEPTSEGRKDAKQSSSGPARSRSKEVNRRAQKKFRERNKVLFFFV